VHASSTGQDAAAALAIDLGAIVAEEAAELVSVAAAVTSWYRIARRRAGALDAESEM